MMTTNQTIEEAAAVPPSRGDPVRDAGVAPIRVMLLSAHEDDSLMRQLVEHLHFAQKDGIELWSSQALLPGSDESDEVQVALAGADLIIVGLSIHFVASKAFPCIAEGLGARLRRGAKVIPLLLGPVDWQASMFGDLRPLPANRLPIALWENKDAGLVDAVVGIRTVIAAQRCRPPLWPSHPCLCSGARAARRVLALQTGAAVLALIVLGSITYVVTRSALPEGPPKVAACACTPAAIVPVPTARTEVSWTPTVTAEAPAEAGEALVFERLPPEAPRPRVTPDAATSIEPPVQVAPPTPEIRAAGDATSSVKVQMPPGKVFAIMNDARRVARNLCRNELARSGSISVSIQFRDDDGGAEKIDVRSPQTLDEDTRQCVRRAFLRARVAPGNEGYRVYDWPVK